ncbi:VaFE repeat-containing surface-anchored protein [Ellagibacter isourolithinifaciens]|uniref:VaFE repeat-containing surface-anchored protein n=1 Tax=Ellagibacter isourolithinifaciens TaxID=2137581 RepID=UPI0023F1ABCD|nr:VaFE repeat-containing surface-anchored protein [Ellagibacter isourolithinifaciens]MDD5925513.1 VaFE repeat-containing surface-anchored protein [Ellagibacter isourolithinifaciens]
MTIANSGFKDKTLRCFLAIALALSSFLGIANPAKAYAAEASIWVSGDQLDFTQTDENTGNTWSDTFMYIDGEVAMCIDVTTSVVDGAWYWSQSMDSSMALRIGLYDKYLWDAYGWWSSATHYGYLQYMIWCEYSPGYMDAYVWPHNDDFWGIYASAKAFYEQNKDNFEAWGTEWHSDYSQNVCIIPHLTELGGVELTKTSGVQQLTDANGCYTLEGAEYGVFGNDSCTSLVGTIVTNADGYGYLGHLASGSYWVKETKRSEGYCLDPTIYPVTVEAGKTAAVNGGKVNELPKSDPIGMLVQKKDADTGEGAPQGAASLKDAEFTVSYYKDFFANAEAAAASGAAERTWVFKTDSDGFAYFSEEYKAAGDEFYYQSDGKTPTMPLGSVVVQETKAPKGYKLDDGNGGVPRKFFVQITSDGTEGESVYAYNTPEVPDTVMRGGVCVRKYDAELGDKPQGDADLKGAVFDIITLNDNAVEVDGKVYDRNSVVKRIATSWSEAEKAYIASTTANCLPYGSYKMVESESPEGYVLNKDWSQRFEISYDGQMVSLTTDKLAVPEDVYRGGVMINKTDEETDVTFQGDATFEGAEFDIVNESSSDVVVNDKTFSPGSVVMTIVTKLDKSCGLAIAKTDAGSLPYGSYRIVETKAPNGYLNKGKVNQPFKVRENGVVVDLTKEPISNDVIRGGVMISKADERSGLEQQGDATFVGAEFTIKNLSENPVLVDGALHANGEVVKVIYTEYDAQSGLSLAKTAPDCLPYGTYSIEETAAPEGYLNTGSLYRTFTVRNEGVIVDLTSKPISNDVIRGGVMINKADSETRTMEQGDATFAGAVFDIVNESLSKVFVEGKYYEPGEVVKTIVTEYDEVTGLAVASTDADCLPYGTYRIVETQSPEGYLNRGTTERVFSVRDNGVIVDLTNSPIENDVIRGGVMINKSDVQTGLNEQGDATFVGAEFSITNMSESPVLVDGVLYAKGEVCKTIVTEFDEESGLAIARTSSDCLPYGTYLLDETSAPEGYLNTGDLHREFKVRKDGIVIDLTSEPIANDVVRGGVMVQKNDTEIDKSEAIGGKEHTSDEGACLAGVGFTITNRSLHNVVVGDEEFEVGAAIEEIFTVWDDELGAYVAKTPSDELPFGTYEIKETTTNKSYLLTDGEPRTFKVREEGAIVTFDAESESLVFRNQVIRNDIELSKKAEDTENAIKAAFALTNTETGETHVLVCDRNGDAATAASWNRHTVRTNANDQLLEKDAIYADDMDQTAGIWFGLGEDGSWAEPNDELGALPYGHYVLNELRSDSNEGYDLITREIWIERDSTIARAVWMSLSDKPSERIQTEARDADDGNHYADADVEVTIVDTVTYQNLKVDGREYSVEGMLMVKETNSPLLDASGNPVTASKTFVPKSPYGEIELEFTFDGSLLAGKTTVVFEDLIRDDKVVATHCDINDQGQSVKLVRIGTTATDDKDGDKTVTGSEASVKDAVSFEGLETGCEYKLVATMMDAETGKAVQRPGILFLTEDVTAEATFVSESVNGEADVTVAFDITGLGGHRLVVFEEVFDNEGELVAVHKDINDEGQSVTVVEIGTTLTDAADGDHLVVSGKVKLIDVIAYKGLTAGETYVAEGTLMSRSTGEPLLGSDHKPVTAKTAFQAEASQGTVEVAFEFDTGDLAEGEIVVAYEKVLDAKGAVVAAHEDLDDEGQSVVVDNPETPEKPKPPYDKTGSSTAPIVGSIAGLAAAGILCGGYALLKNRRTKESENEKDFEE